MHTKQPHSPASADGTASASRSRLGLGPLGIAIRAVIAVAILMGGNLLVGALSALLMLVPGGSELMNGADLTSLIVFILLQGAMLAFVVMAVWLWMRFVEGRRLRDAGWVWTRWSALWLTLSIVVSGGLVFAAVAVLPSTGPNLTEADLGSTAPVWFSIVALLCQAFLLQAIPEELLFRGWLLSALRARPVLAIAVTTLVFTVIHLISNGGQQSPLEYVLYLALPFGFSLLAMGMLLWTQSLWAAIGVHGGFHLGYAAAVIGLPQVDAALSWLVIGGVHAAVGMALIITALRRHRRILDPGRVT
ncbi:lysostaphin resistance A-like protein [Microbacterium sp. A84]|uniref:lysostaphin resistance A-like protein n=1 Tax=Microbacterium sp. A84 TaxID=3450715 RepID=UPI003F43BA4F